MNILLIGGGGREHAILRKLRENPTIEKIYALPGNGGFEEAECFPISAVDIPAQIAFAKEHAVDYVIVTPDDPLALGAVDAFEKEGFPCFGPNQAAARIEASKAFAKDLMKKYQIPTAAYEVFDDEEKAIAFVEEKGAPLVVKADGLALGKGVIIAFSEEEAKEAVHEMMSGHAFGKAGDRIIIEEYLEGPEVSILSFTDGETLIPMVSSMDHKRALDGDQGLNTGGMGTIAPNPYYTEAIAEESMKTIFLPTIRAMKEEGCPFKGCLYFSLMLTADGPKVIEYNSRFGDPETQVVLPLLESDLYTIMKATTDGTLKDTEVKFSDKAACCVVVASGGYPRSYPKGLPITMSEETKAHTYVAGAKKDENGQLLTSGGRVLGVTAVKDTLPEAVQEAYRLVEGVSFEGAFYRHDIGKRALEAEV
ncbi:MAG: phosphoribosylamine--glycine ligase [Erysipelotrichaceae bacterium]|nr:phosphoribosylamine--glycine ligase [Erysipelotrichaceae bacterium]